MEFFLSSYMGRLKHELLVPVTLFLARNGPGYYYGRCRYYSVSHGVTVTDIENMFVEGFARGTVTVRAIQRAHLKEVLLR